MKRLIILAACLALAGCDGGQTEARETLDAYGFTDVQLTGYAWFGCGRDDSFHNGFTAVTAAGRRVRGVVCSGWAKGATVRILGGAA